MRLIHRRKTIRQSCCYCSLLYASLSNLFAQATPKESYRFFQKSEHQKVSIIDPATHRQQIAPVGPDPVMKSLPRQTANWRMYRTTSVPGIMRWP